MKVGVLATIDSDGNVAMETYEGITISALIIKAEKTEGVRIVCAERWEVTNKEIRVITR